MKHIMEELFKTNRWYLLSTKPRSEKIAYGNLNNQGHETFAPSKNFEENLENFRNRQRP